MYYTVIMIIIINYAVIIKMRIITYYTVIIIIIIHNGIIP